MTKLGLEAVLVADSGEDGGGGVSKVCSQAKNSPSEIMHTTRRES